MQLDITDPASVTAAAAAAPDTTLLINHAGVLTATALLTGDLSDISAEFDTSFYGTLVHWPVPWSAVLAVPGCSCHGEFEVAAVPEAVRGGLGVPVQAVAPVPVRAD